MERAFSPLRTNATTLVLPSSLVSNFWISRDPTFPVAPVTTIVWSGDTADESLSKDDADNEHETVALVMLLRLSTKPLTPSGSSTSTTIINDKVVLFASLIRNRDNGASAL
mmetsp:Transcript_41449/g.49726  ORF Transcript_41449/g.49726 Transcript_41449/m.49726 type:complete len:111 (+) Transcript_41449:2496-2828(+)